MFGSAKLEDWGALPTEKSSIVSFRHPDSGSSDNEEDFRTAAEMHLMWHRLCSTQRTTDFLRGKFRVPSYLPISFCRWYFGCDIRGVSYIFYRNLWAVDFGVVICTGNRMFFFFFWSFLSFVPLSHPGLTLSLCVSNNMPRIGYCWWQNRLLGSQRLCLLTNRSSLQCRIFLEQSLLPLAHEK